MKMESGKEKTRGLTNKFDIPQYLLIAILISSCAYTWTNSEPRLIKRRVEKKGWSIPSRGIIDLSRTFHKGLRTFYFDSSNVDFDKDGTKTASVMIMQGLGNSYCLLYHLGHSYVVALVEDTLKLLQINQ